MILKTYKKPVHLLRPKGSKKRRTPERHVMAKQHDDVVEQRRAMVRKLVLEHGRIDVFAEYIIDRCHEDPPVNEGPQWFHIEMMEFQDTYDEGMILAFPGARKTQYCTVTRALFEIVRNPNIRILFIADATEQAKTFLRGVKSHLEKNDELRATFGDYVTGAEKWTDGEIIVNKRTAVGLREPTIMCAGVDTSLIGRHFEVILADDLVTEENSSTEHQRERVKKYFYGTLLSRLQPDGRMWVIGQRWHEGDLYGWLADNDYKESTFTLPVLDEESEDSVWEDKFPTARMHRYRQGNLSAFELQWMCKTGANLSGQIFNESHFVYVDDYPRNYFKWQAADLAAGQKARNDFFAHATIMVEKTTRGIWLVEIHEKKLTFPAQTKFIAGRFDEHPETVRVGIEANAYQIALTQQVRQDFPHVPVHPIYTQKDKVARAQQLAQIATTHPFHVRRQHGKFVRRMCAFPNGPKDVFDAFEMAVGLGLRGVRKRRQNEPSLI